MNHVQRPVKANHGIEGYFARESKMASHKVRTWKQAEDRLRNVQTLKDSPNTYDNTDLLHHFSA